jgi:hypothetical protein
VVDRVATDDPEPTEGTSAMTSITIASRRSLQRFAALALPVALCLPLGASSGGGSPPCNTAASETLQSCRRQAASDYWLARAKCTNLSSGKNECLKEAQDAFNEALELCGDQYEERIDVCADLGGGIYDPTIDPRDYVLGVNHPYFPLVGGITLVYETQTGEGVERDEVSLTGNTREILGVTCTEVHDVVTLEGVLIEDTLDWFTQDSSGNVWYFGELAMNFEDGELDNLDGSWEAGIDGAKPGIVMEADPEVGDVYRQEFLIAEAEDIAEVMDLAVTVVVPYGVFTGCLQTEDQTPIEPDVEENKYYAAGVGLVLSINLETGERAELVDSLVE